MRLQDGFLMDPVFSVVTTGLYTYVKMIPVRRELQDDMVRTIRLALAQINLTVGDLPGNTARMLDYLQQAREAGADIVAFPELATTGYPPEDLLFKKSFVDANVRAMEEVVSASDGIAVVLGYVQPRDAGVANSAAVAFDGRLIDSYDKIFLPNYGVFDEERYFVRGNACPVYEMDNARIGVNVCEDIWYETGPTSVQRRAGAELIININASPFHAGKSAYRRDNIVGSRATENGLFIAYLNTVGGQDELVFDGNSMICDPSGEVLARGPAFREALVIADINLDRTPHASPVAAAKIGQADLDAVGVPRLVQIPARIGDPSERHCLCRPSVAAPTAVGDGPDEVEEIYRALVLGTRDYLHKTGFRKAIVGLSGGIDSALTAVVAADALGPENVLGITMPSRYSSRAASMILLTWRTTSASSSGRYPSSRPTKRSPACWPNGSLGPNPTLPRRTYRPASAGTC